MTDSGASTEQRQAYVVAQAAQAVYAAHAASCEATYCEVIKQISSILSSGY